MTGGGGCPPSLVLNQTRSRLRGTRSERNVALRFFAPLRMTEGTLAGLSRGPDAPRHELGVCGQAVSTLEMIVYGSSAARRAREAPLSR